MTHCISTQLFKQKVLSVGKPAPHSGVSHHMLGLWTIMWSQPQNRWSSPSCVWDFPWSCACSVEQAGGELVWHGDMRDLYLRRPVKRSPLSLSKGRFFIQSSYMLHAFIKPGEIWASLKNRSGNFYFLFSDPNFYVCIMGWAKENMVWISDLVNIHEMYCSPVSKSANFFFVSISKIPSCYTT